SASSLPLVIFGGLGNDTITSGTGNDIVFGDSGRVEYVDTFGTVVQVLGNGGPGDRIDGLTQFLGTISSSDPAAGGSDQISSGPGDDILLGGTGDDIINAGDGKNLVFGDNGLITPAQPGGSSFGGQPIRLARVETVAPLIDGGDQITTGVGADIVFGG